LPAAVRAGLPASSETAKVKKRHCHVALLPLEANSHVKWSYSLNGGDIAFFVFFAPASVDVESFPSSKLTHTPPGCSEVVAPVKMLSFSGEYISTEDGHLVLVRAVILVCCCRLVAFSGELYALRVGLGQYPLLASQPYSHQVHRC
jgi:hypothetical protein